MADQQNKEDFQSMSSADSSMDLYQSVSVDPPIPESSAPSRPFSLNIQPYPSTSFQPKPEGEGRITPDSIGSSDFPRVQLDNSLESDLYIDIDSDHATVIETSDRNRAPNEGRHRDSSAPGPSQELPYVIRKRGARETRDTICSDELSSSFQDARNLQYEIVVKPENVIEAQRMVNNHLFGFRKWKSHVTSRPLSERSQVVKELYTDPHPQRDKASTCSFGNVMYVILFGWWQALLYGIMGCLMMMTFIGRRHGMFCFKLAAYFFWPFGKFIHKITPKSSEVSNANLASLVDPPGTSPDDHTPLLASTEIVRRERREKADRTFSHKATGYWSRPSTYVWLFLAVPLLAIVHCLVFLLAWITVVFVPVAKINAKTIRRLLLLPPELCYVDTSSISPQPTSTDIVLFVHSAANLYYYKYTLDGVNIICVNCLALVPVAIGLGYGDRASVYVTEETKFVLALMAIMPLAYCIGMAITCLSAQTGYALGAVINATFGSLVEIILYVAALVNNKRIHTDSGTTTGGCYAELVKSGLVGTLLAMTMLVPGLGMMIGGWKHRTLRFNARSAGVGATLLFVCVAGVFAPSIFARSFSQLKCRPCANGTVINGSIITAEGNSTLNECMDCEYNEPTAEFYVSSIRPLVYICMVLLPLAYVIGLYFSHKTHHSFIYDTFTADVGEGTGHHHAVLWGKTKSLVVLLVGITFMSLCADLVTENIQPILNKSGISVYFVGVTLLALVPDIPEIVIGIQFALQNQMSLSIEVGSCIAVQVCMIQVPFLVLADLVYPMGFMLIFTDVHIWSVLLGVFMMNYIYQDGKSDYFQGSAMVISYCIMIAMYFYIPNPSNMPC